MSDKFKLNAISFGTGIISGALGTYWWLQFDLAPKMALILFVMSTLGFAGGWFRAAARYSE